MPIEDGSDLIVFVQLNSSDYSRATVLLLKIVVNIILNNFPLCEISTMNIISITLKLILFPHVRYIDLGDRKAPTTRINTFISIVG